MTTGRFLLDTNIVIALNKSDLSVAKNIQSAEFVALSITVAGELLYGARRSARRDQNLQQVESLLQSITVLNCDLETARQYARIKEALQRKGRPIPENDIWIAALASQHGLTVATRDSDFSAIPDLEITLW
ncbi:MAG: type II toxin-antitoxin system VapC family toxin [Cyanobacteria bacterium]|nr:type II toxin-antitoxin system VapC family toxin [Cyanobacteriota bacterium]